VLSYFPPPISVASIGDFQFASAPIGTILALHVARALLDNSMDEREYVVTAQEAEAFANAADKPSQQFAWESIAKEYRRRAKLAGDTREIKPSRA
jgi:hypothetical protein